ncbi:MAG: ABC transporter permease [Oscillibacter sp.]
MWEQSIKDLGYSTYSMQSMRDELNKQTRQIELMLGGLGAISLLVAAIGITNTMIMSISERTKEIGIMKALGCYVRDIRAMFLMEAGSIGLLGGILGLIFSFIISVIINLFSFGAFGGGGVTWSLSSRRSSAAKAWCARPSSSRSS